MESVNNGINNLMLQKTLTNGLDKVNAHGKTCANKNVYNFDNAGACILNNMSTTDFDITMDNLVTFSDMLGTAQNSLSKMREQGDALLALINKAHEGDYTQDELASMNADATALIESINNTFNSCEFNGINPLQTQFGIKIPDWQNVVKQFTGADEAQAASEDENTKQSDITNVLADISLDFDMSANIDGNTVNMQAAANIQIGFTDDGALQITVDASLDYDLSGIEQNGVNSDNALDVITKFLGLLSGTQNDFNNVNGLINNLLGGSEVKTENSDNNDISSSELKGKILQQATITLDGAYQMPNIAINLL